MTREELARFRLRRHHLTAPPLPTPESVVRWLGAVQSQEFAVAKWSVARRTRGLVTSAQMDQALAAGAILRTHLMRPTWHFVLPEDLRWIMQLTAPRVHALSAYYYRQLGVTEKLVARTQAVIHKALAGGQQQTRNELADLLARAGIGADRLRLGYLLMRAELDLLICSGALRGKQQTYALCDERVPPSPALPREEALAGLIRRYFSSHGPATLKDFLWWSSLTATEARRGLEMLKGELHTLELEGRTYWLTEPPPRRRKPEPPTVHLLQAYDEYVVAYTESKSVFLLDRLASADRAIFNHAIAHDGQVVGRWRRVPSAKEAIVEAQLLRPLDSSGQRALQADLERYGRFMQLPPRLILGAPSRSRALAKQRA